MITRRSSPGLILVAWAALVASSIGCRAACRREGSSARPLGGALALVPREARFVVSIDLAQIRESPLWARLAAVAEDDPEDKQRLAAFTQETGLDPLTQIRSVLLAFPDDARATGGFVAVVRGEGFDEKRLIAWAQERAREAGTPLRSRTQGRRTLWSEGRDGGASGFFVDFRTFVLGGGGWAEKAADLADGAPGAAAADADLDFARLCERAAGSGARAIWLSAVVSPEVRRELAAEPRFASAASVARLGGGIRIDRTLAVEIEAQVSNAADAADLARRASEAVREAKRNPQVLMLGLGPHLDGLKATADGPTFRATLTLSEAQAADVVGRLAALLEVAAGRKKR